VLVITMVGPWYAPCSVRGTNVRGRCEALPGGGQQHGVEYQGTVGHIE
jgi:hypothetical protein